VSGSGRGDATVSLNDASLAGVSLEGGPCLYQVLECDQPLAAPRQLALTGVSAVVIGRGERGSERTGVRGRELVVRVPDEKMSSSHARLEATGRGFTVRDLDSKNGTLVNGEPCPSGKLSDGDVLEVGQTFFVYREQVASLPGDLPVVVGSSDQRAVLALATLQPGLARQYERVAKLAPSSLSIVVLGETGTGKEVVARAIHGLSGRHGPFVAVNCGALPAQLVESELFGSRKGAFSGATEDRLGLVRAADKGTLFLDEIGELPAPAQVALLRFLQEQEVLAVGASKPVKVDVRVVAATHRELDRLVDGGQFRSDLYGRLVGYTVRLPPLRERREDLGLILAALLKRVVARPQHVRLTRRAARALMLYQFPRNIRELEKALAFASAMGEAGASDGLLIDREHLPDTLQQARFVAQTGETSPSEAAEADAAEAAADEARKQRLLELLAQHQGRIAPVAEAMGKARMQIHRWIQRYAIDLESFRKR
jgi:DNA-binding NtrC family response regulator